MQTNNSDSGDDFLDSLDFMNETKNANSSNITNYSNQSAEQEPLVIPEGEDLPDLDPDFIDEIGTLPEPTLNSSQSSSNSSNQTSDLSEELTSSIETQRGECTIDNQTCASSEECCTKETFILDGE